MGLWRSVALQPEVGPLKTVMLAGRAGPGCSGSESCQATQRAKCKRADATRWSYPPDGVLILLSGQKLPEHVLQDAAVVEVPLLLGRVDPHGDLELLVVGGDRQLAGD
jgi:hypothetical protein